MVSHEPCRSFHGRNQQHSTPPHPNFPPSHPPSPTVATTHLQIPFLSRISFHFASDHTDHPSWECHLRASFPDLAPLIQRGLYIGASDKEFLTELTRLPLTYTTRRVWPHTRIFEVTQLSDGVGCKGSFVFTYNTLVIPHSLDPNILSADMVTQAAAWDGYNTMVYAYNRKSRRGRVNRVRGHEQRGVEGLWPWPRDNGREQVEYNDNDWILGYARFQSFVLVAILVVLLVVPVWQLFWGGKR